LVVCAQEEEEDEEVVATDSCDCSADVESAKQDTAQSFQNIIDELNQKLNDAAASVGGKDGEIAKLTAQVQEVTSSLTAKVEELTAKLTKSVAESQAASKASAKALTELESKVKKAKDEASDAQQQVSKYVSARFYINIPLLKQDLNSLLKKIGLGGKAEEL
jgi:ABC-type transporter Mla subunit MlaD